MAYNVSLPFSDVSDTNPCFPYVWAVYSAGVMGGVTSTQFQPGNPITRAQIALAIQRALGINPNGTYQASDICDLYDVSTESGTAILALFDHNITSGKTSNCLVGGTCTTTTYHYCPQDYVTRNELGVFLWRADDPGSTMDCPTCPSSRYFCDSGGATGCGCIEALGADLPSKGSCSASSTCSPTAYCPADNVTRCEAATALANVFSLSLPPVCM
jgi:hypothetical protein